MLRRLKEANTEPRIRWRERSGTGTGEDAGAATSLDGNEPHCSGAGTRPAKASPTRKDFPAAPAPATVLSVRAENVLKEWAAALTRQDPPTGRWVPPGSLLRKLSYRDLQVARNCGPQTTAEIIRWAGSQGVVIEPPLHAGKSLSAMWRDVIARSSTGEFMRAEIAEALERSLRRKNTRIPVAFQNLLLKALSGTGQG